MIDFFTATNKEILEYFARVPLASESKPDHRQFQFGVRKCLYILCQTSVHPHNLEDLHNLPTEL